MAAADNPTELLPILSDDRGFDVAMRGYDRAQVDHYLARLDEEIRALSAERDATTSRSADLAAQLASAHAQIESLRRQLNTATETVTADNVEPRIKQMLENAAAQAATIRAEAEAEATATRQAAEDTFRVRLADVEEHRTEVESRLAAQTAAVRETVDRLGAESAAERTRLDDEAAAERKRLDDESAARRALADEDFEITLRKRRTAETAVSDQQRAAAKQQAEDIVAQAHQQAADLIAAAAAELARLEAERDELHQRLVALHTDLGSSIATYVASAQASAAGTPPSDEADETPPSAS